MSQNHNESCDTFVIENQSEDLWLNIKQWVVAHPKQSIAIGALGLMALRNERIRQWTFVALTTWITTTISDMNYTMEL